MEKISKQDETRLLRALEQTADLVKAGSHPNEALLKVVKQGEFASFTPQMVQRMVEATNTAMQLSHMKKASGEARAESFPLVDPKVVFEDLYPAKVEAPVTKAAAAVVPNDYQRGETRDFMKAAKSLPEFPKAAAYPPDIQIRAHRTMAIHRGLLKKAEAARSAYRRQAERVLGMAKYAADYFKQLDHKPFADVERYVVSEYGAVGKSCMDFIYGFTNGREKRASLENVETLIFDRRVRPFDLVASVVEEARKIPGLAKEAEDAQATEKKHETDFVDKIKPKKKTSPKPLDRIMDSSEPVSTECKAASVKDILGGSDSPFFPKAAFDLTEPLLEGGQKALGLGDSKPVNMEALSKIMDPEHEAEIRGIKTKAMLHEFMTTDPIISSYDSDKITGAFNQISQLAPNVASQPAVMRGLMRKILQQEGVLEPFETDQITKLEKQLTPSTRDMPAEASAEIGQLERGR